MIMVPRSLNALHRSVLLGVVTLEAIACDKQWSPKEVAETLRKEIGEMRANDAQSLPYGLLSAWSLDQRSRSDIGLAHRWLAVLDEALASPEKAIAT